MNYSKIALVGECNAGKTALGFYIRDGNYSDKNPSTLGAHYLVYKYEKNAEINIWDTSGQEKFSLLLPSYYRGSMVLLLVYDMSNKNMEFKLKHNLDQIRLILSEQHYKIIVVGTKIDVLSTIQVDEVYERVNNLLKIWTDESGGNYDDIFSHIKTSCKNNIGRDKLLAHILEACELVKKLNNDKKKTDAFKINNSDKNMVILQGNEAYPSMCSC